MTAYIIVDIEVHDEAHYMDYVRQAPAHIERYGGEYVIRGGNAETFEGDWCPRRFVVVKFPSKERAKEFLEDPDYQAVAEIRRSTTTSKLIVAEGFEG
jgi:uncharacterized protein (DUF1330 family)